MTGARITSLVWTVEAVPVVLEVHTGTIVAVEDENGESGRRLLNDGDFPISQNGISRPIPVTSKPLALAERQLIDDTGRKAVVEIDRRWSPIQLLISGQREIGCSDKSAETV